MKRNVKSILTLLLALLLTVSLFAACEGNSTTPTEPNNAASEGPVKLWFGYNTDNFMQDLEYEDEMEERDYTLRMYGIRGDVESVQLIVTPNVNVVEYDFVAADLTNENGDVFSAENFDVFAEWYVDVTSSYNMDSYFGFYPDALVPFENFKLLHHNSIDAGENQGIWVNANIGVDQAPGFYTGSAVLTIDGTEYNVPMELTVYDAQMPEQNHQPSSFDIWWDQITYGEGQYTTEIAQAYFDILVDHRVMPLYPDKSKTADWDVYVQWLVDEMAENPRISSYGLPYNYGTNSEGYRIVNKNSLVDLLSKMAVKNVELREAGNETIDLFDKAFYYLGAIIDEPSGGMIPIVAECDLLISQAKFEVAEKYLKDYEDLYRSCMGVNHVVTTAYNPDLLGSDTTGGVQTWCPQFQNYHSEEQRAQYAERQKTPDRLMGEGAWWYGCNNPKVPFPTYHLDDDLISSRLISWMQFNYNIDGDLYWCVNYHKGYEIWKTPTVTESAGEGNLTYPGARYGIVGPIPTLRLESIREGREDFECLWLMEQEIIKYNEANGTDYDPEELMQHLYEDLYDGAIPERDNDDVFMARRIAMLEALELMCTDPAAGIELLQEG